MVKNDNINVRLEVCKDKNSGRLSITAHFDSDAPNVVIDNNGYFWLPTNEEKDFINEAFQLVSADLPAAAPIERTPRVEEKKEMKSFTDLPPLKERTPRIEEKKEIKSFDDLPPLKRQKESTVFEAKGEDTKDEDSERGVFGKKEDFRVRRQEIVEEEPRPAEKETRQKEGDKTIVEADNDAIDAALKKRMQDDDSFVEVDEQTIIDKVLSQKKKGKWSKK